MEWSENGSNGDVVRFRAIQNLDKMSRCTCLEEFHAKRKKGDQKIVGGDSSFTLCQKSLKLNSTKSQPSLTHNAEEEPSIQRRQRISSKMRNDNMPWTIAQ